MSRLFTLTRPCSGGVFKIKYIAVDFYSFLLSSLPNNTLSFISYTSTTPTKTTMLFATVFTSLLAAGLALAQDYTVNTPVRFLLIDLALLT